MGRGNQKQTTIGRDFARKPYVSKDFYEMMNVAPNAAVWAGRGAEKHSMFEKSYLRDHSYAKMQHYHQSGLRLPYRLRQPNADPLGGVDPCRGTVHATLDGIISPFHYVECGTSHTIGMDGGVGPFELAGVAGILAGDVSGTSYIAPPCETCKDDVTDHIQISDECGRTPNLIIKTVFPEGREIIDIEGPEIPVDGDCYGVIGGVAPIQWSMSVGVIDDLGCVTVTGECGTATITAEDACGSVLTREVLMPDGVWVLDSTDIHCEGGISTGYCESISGASMTREHYKFCGGATNNCAVQCTSAFCDNCSVLRDRPCSGLPACTFAFCWYFKTKTETYTWECP